MWVGHERGVINDVGEKKHKMPCLLFFVFSLRYFPEIVDKFMVK